MNKKIISYFFYLWNSPTFTTWGSLAVSSLRLSVLFFIIKTLSNAEASVWFLFMNLLAIGNLADLGFSPTFTRMTAYILGGIDNFSNFVQKKDKQASQNSTNSTNSINSTNSTTKNTIHWELMEQLYGTIGTVNLILSILAALILAIFGTWSLWKPVSALENQAVYWQAWAVLCLSIAIIFHGKKYEAILNGLNYVALVNRWNIIFGMASVLASLLVLVLEGNILHLMLSSQLFAIVTLFRNRYLLLYEVYEKKFSHFKTFSFQSQIFTIAFASAWRQGISTFFAVGITEGTGLMYAQISEASRLVSYQFAFRFISQLAEFSKAPFYSKLPEFARLRAANQIDILTFRTEKSMQLALLFFVCGGLAIGLVAPFALQIMHVKIQFVAANFWLFLLFVHFMDRMIAMHAQQYLTTNRMPYHKTIFITGCLNLLIIYFGISYLDLWIFPVAQGIANAVIHLWWIPKISIQTLQRPAYIYLWNSLALPFFVLVFGAMFILYVGHLFS
jgi:hypothetical protein